MKQKISNILVYITLFLSIFLVSAVSVNAAQTAVNLGTAGNFVILAKSGISNTGTTLITGDIGVSPIDSTGITGFGLIMDASNEFATSSLITGKIYAADYTPPTPNTMTTAVSDMETAYTDAAGRTNPTATELGAGNIGGMTLAPGLYTWGTGVTIPTDVTISGGANDVWIFQIAQDLDISSATQVKLSGGAQAKNIFWQVAGVTTLGTTSSFNGIILSQTAIVINTGATLNGRALAQTAVTLDANAVTAPTSSAALAPNPTPTPSTTQTTAIKSSAGSGNEASSESEGRNTAQTGIQTSTQTNTNAYPSVEKNQIAQGIGQELNARISARKEEIKSGEYTSHLGQQLNVRELAHNLTELRVNGVSAQTDLNITAETDSEGKTKFKVMLHNGQNREIKIMPDTASERALESLRIKVCSVNNNCTIQLKDVGSGAAEKIQYEVQVERHSMILGIFQKKMQVSADVNAETGDTTVHKPWWAIIASEPAE